MGRRSIYAIDKLYTDMIVAITTNARSILLAYLNGTVMYA